MKTCFHSHFYANFYASVTVLFLFGFSCNFHQNVEIGNDIHHFRDFFSYLNWEGANIRPQIRPRKILVHWEQSDQDQGSYCLLP